MNLIQFDYSLKVLNITLSTWQTNYNYKIYNNSLIRFK